MQAPDSAIAQPGAAEFGRHRNSQPAGFHHGLEKVARKDAFTVALEPVLVGKPRAVLQDGFADVLLIGGE
jgi:hypothetical protein